MSPDTSIQITVIVAGTNDPSNSHLLAEKFKEGAVSQGADAALVRLKDMHLDRFDLRFYDASYPNNDRFKEIAEAIKRSDGLVIASPIWNFSVPAHLKNLIDRMGSFGLDEATRTTGTLSGKPTFLIFTGGSPSVAWPLYRRTLSHISIGLQYFGCSVVGTHFEGGCTLGRGKFGLVVDKRPASLAAIAEKGKSFVQLVQKFKATGDLPLQFRIKRSVVKAGQRVRRRLGW